MNVLGCSAGGQRGEAVGTTSRNRGSGHLFLEFQFYLYPAPTHSRAGRLFFRTQLFSVSYLIFIFQSTLYLYVLNLSWFYGGKVAIFWRHSNFTLHFSAKLINLIFIFTKYAEISHLLLCPLPLSLPPLAYTSLYLYYHLVVFGTVSNVCVD